MEAKSQLVSQMPRQGLLPTWEKAATKGADHSLGMYAWISPVTHQQYTLRKCLTLTVPVSAQG